MDPNCDYQFIQVPMNLFYLMDANCSKVLITLVQMNSFYPKEDDYFECAYKTLELACGMSRPVIKSSLAGLYLEGIVDVVSVGQGRGKHTNRYKVNVEKFKDYEKINLGIAIMTEDKPIHQVKYKGERFQVPWDEKPIEKQSEKGTEKQSEKKVTTNINNIENIPNIENINNINIIDNNIKEEIGKEVTTISQTKPIDYYLELFCNYNNYFDYNMLIYEQDRFYDTYQYPVDKLVENICRGTGSTLCKEAVLNYLGEYVRETGRLR